MKIRRRKGRVGSRAESTSIVTSGFSSLPVKIKPLYRSTNVTKLSVRTQVGKPSERAFQPAIERQKQTSELRIMKKIPYRATPQTHTQKERQDRKSLISLRKKKTLYKIGILDCFPPPHDNNPLLLYYMDIFSCRPCGTPPREACACAQYKTCGPCGTHVEKLCMCVIWCTCNTLHGFEYTTFVPK